MWYNTNMSLKEDIVLLRAEGLTYSQIANRLGCAKSTVAQNLDSRQMDAMRGRSAEQRRIARQEIFNRYGDSCAICGFSDKRALHLDHINNDGYKDRKDGQRGGVSFYLKLKKNGYPDGYQILCANCNTIKQWEHGKYDRPV